MQHERVSKDIHVFISDIYAQVTAGLIVTNQGCVMIDTLPVPEETTLIADFVKSDCPGGVHQIILTHYHADHTYGAFLFPQATVVSHALTREILATKGADALAEAKLLSPELAQVELVLPSVVFEDSELDLHIGQKTMRLIHCPGHTPDSIVTYVEEDKTLFAADAILPVPTIFDGDLETLTQSLERLKDLAIDNIVQGHGEVILRGEVTARIDRAIKYLQDIHKLVSDAINAGEPREQMLQANIEDCGLSRIPLNGVVQQLHVANLLSLYDKMSQS